MNHPKDAEIVRKSEHTTCTDPELKNRGHTVAVSHPKMAGGNVWRKLIHRDHSRVTFTDECITVDNHSNAHTMKRRDTETFRY